MANERLSLAKDWIYVLCTGIQTVVAIIGLLFVSFWWDRRKTKDERKRADKQRREEKRQKEIQREEDRQKADAERIAAILTKNYYEVENVFHRLKRKVDELREEQIVGDLTEFQVLLYMCRPGNWHKCNKTDVHLNHLISNSVEYAAYRRSLTAPRDEILSHVEEIMKFFLNFRINLFSIMQNKACPADIKSEFASKITKMGETIYPFVEKHRQDVIKRVLKYFLSAPNIHHATHHALGAATVQEDTNPEDQLPSTRQWYFLCPRRSIPGVSKCCGRQETSQDEARGLAHDTSIEMAPTTSPSIESSSANQGPELLDYPGDAAIENAIPYLKYFKYSEGSMKLDFWNKRPDIDALMTRVELGEMQEKEDEILEKIGELWQLNNSEPPGGGLLHSMRMIMFKLSEDTHFFNKHEGSLNEFRQYVRSIASVDLSNNTKVLICERTLDDIDCTTKRLRTRFKPLLVLTETNEMLERVKSTLDEFLSRQELLEHQAQQEQPQLVRLRWVY